jgi:hypothetical protein
LKQVPRRTRRLRRPQHVIAARVGAGIVVLLVAVTLVTSFTASTNVPVSHAGTSAQARTIMQLAPAGCTSLALTVLVQGSGTFSNSQSHALVLGSAGSNTITDTGTGNCIVGGGGTDSTTGSATDICITGPTLNIANPCPVAAPTLTYAISGTQPTTAIAGTVFDVSVHALSNGALDTTYTGAHSLTWGGANASPSATVATLPSPTWASGSVTIPITLVATGTQTLTMTDGTARNLTFAPITVTDGTAARLAFTGIDPAPVTLPCYFTCPLTGYGRGTTATFTISVTDAEGNVESSIGSGHTVTFTFANAGTGASGTPTAAQAFPATGAAVSPRFTFTSSSSTSWTTATLTLAANATYTSATAAISQ